jgi:hypothetical protein
VGGCQDVACCWILLLSASHTCALRCAHCAKSYKG